MKMKKLGKTLIVISLALLVVDYAFATLWGLRIEPAGNLFQLMYINLSYQLARIISYLGFAFTNSHMELFWLGVALWFVGSRDTKND
jgi:hypothetical protein